MTETTLRSTPLREAHLAVGARLVPFAGFDMPVQYPTGIQAEHRAVRERAGLFDVCHMGEIDVRGDDAVAFLQYLTVNDVSKIEPWQAQYSAMCSDTGGVIDDLLVYRFPDHWMLVVNASNRARDLAWMQQQAKEYTVTLEDRSDQVGLLALQGPAARAILAELTDTDLDAIRYYHFAEGTVADAPAVISATGYTGEDGFELYMDPGGAVRAWDALLKVGGDQVIPAGLGARDSLRLEMGYALHGNDLDEAHSPLESALGWIVKLDKGEFVGRDILTAQKEAGLRQRLVGLQLGERAFARPGYPIIHEGKEVGTLTSGTLSPSMKTGIGLGRVPVELAALGTELGIRIRDKVHLASVVRPPFYSEGSIRR